MRCMVKWSKSEMDRLIAGGSVKMDAQYTTPFVVIVDSLTWRNWFHADVTSPFEFGETTYIRTGKGSASVNGESDDEASTN